MGTFSLASAGAWAVDPAVFDDDDAGRAAVGGATASDSSMRNLFALDPADAETGSRAACTANSLDIYFRGNDYPDLVHVDRATSQASRPAVTSSWSRRPRAARRTACSSVARQTNLDFINPIECEPDLLHQGPTSSQAADLMAYQSSYVHDGARLKQRCAPQVGISDVDPTTFVGTAGVTTADAACSKRRAGPAGRLRTDRERSSCAIVCRQVQGLAVGSDALADVPSIPRSVLNGMFTAQVLDWSQVLHQWPVPLARARPTPTAVPCAVVPRRSGTQTSSRFTISTRTATRLGNYTRRS